LRNRAKKQTNRQADRQTEEKTKNATLQLPMAWLTTA